MPLAIRRSRLRAAGLVGLLAAAAAIAALWLHGPVAVRIEQDRIRAAVDAKLPIEGKRLGVSYAIRTVSLDFGADGRAAFSAVSMIDLAKSTYQVSFGGTSRLDYRSGEFFLSDFRMSEGVDIRQDRGGVLVQPAFFPSLDGSRLQASLNDAIQGAVVTAFRSVLEKTPVYSLPDDSLRDGAVRLLLRDLRIEDGAVVAILDPLALLGRAALSVIVFLSVVCAIGFLASFSRTGPLPIIALSLVD